MDFEDFMYQLLHAHNQGGEDDFLAKQLQEPRNANVYEDAIDALPLKGNGDLYQNDGPGTTVRGGFGGGVRKDFTGKDAASLLFRILQAHQGWR